MNTFGSKFGWKVIAMNRHMPSFRSSASLVGREVKGLFVPPQLRKNNRTVGTR